MDLRLRLFLLFIICGVLAATGFQVTRQLRPSGPTRESIGLEWLRQEYQLTDEAFARVRQLHRNYFSLCDAMCAEMIEAHRPPSMRLRARLAPSNPGENLRREKAICERCLNTMIDHLREVSTHMAPDQARRFLSDILPEVIHPPELGNVEAQLRTVVQ